MERHETAAVGNEFEQGFFLIRRDFRPIRVDDQTIVSCQFRWIQIVERTRVFKDDILGCEHRLQLFEAISRTMMTIIAEKEHPQLLGQDGSAAGEF